MLPRHACCVLSRLRCNALTPSGLTESRILPIAPADTQPAKTDNSADFRRVLKNIALSILLKTVAPFQSCSHRGARGVVSPPTEVGFIIKCFMCCSKGFSVTRR